MITDGVVGLPEASLFESLMGQLRHSTISCSFIQIGEDFQHNAGLGHVPYLDMLSYMAMSTFGVLFTRLPQLVIISCKYTKKNAKNQIDVYVSKMKKLCKYINR